jgi:hypothetical protein
VHANYSDPSYRRRFVHDRFRPEQIARALRATKGGIAAASKMLGCTRNTVLWYLGQYPELRETAQDEVVRALDRAEHSLFPDAASGDPGARRFLLLARGRERGYVIRREGVTANGQPLSSAHGNAVIVIGGDKQQYLDGLRRLRDATDAARSASINARSVPLPGDGHRHNGDLPG